MNPLPRQKHVIFWVYPTVYDNKSRTSVAAMTAEGWLITEHLTCEEYDELVAAMWDADEPLEALRNHRHQFISGYALARVEKWPGSRRLDFVYLSGPEQKRFSVTTTEAGVVEDMFEKMTISWDAKPRERAADVQAFLPKLGTAAAIVLIGAAIFWVMARHAETGDPTIGRGKGRVVNMALASIGSTNILILATLALMAIVIYAIYLVQMRPKLFVVEPGRS